MPFTRTNDRTKGSIPAPNWLAALIAFFRG